MGFFVQFVGRGLAFAFALGGLTRSQGFGSGSRTFSTEVEFFLLFQFRT